MRFGKGEISIVLGEIPSFHIGSHLEYDVGDRFSKKFRWMFSGEFNRSMKGKIISFRFMKYKLFILKTMC